MTAMRCFLFLFLLVLIPRTVQAYGQVYLVLSDSGPAYQEVAEEFKAAYGQRPVTQWQASEVSDEQFAAISREANLIVPVGLKALRTVVERHAGQASVLALMVPRASAERQVWPAGLARRKVSAVYIDQPLGRSLDLAGMLVSGKGKAGVLLSRESLSLMKQLEHEAIRRGLNIEPAIVESGTEVGPALRRLLPEIQVLLLLPDTTTLNSTNMQSILLGAYRQRVPVVGFSAGQVRAGAAVASFTTPGQIGRQAGQMAQRWAHDAVELPMAQMGAEFSVVVNRQVVRSLDLSLPDDEDLRRYLAARPE